MIGFPEGYTISEGMLRPFKQELTIFVVPRTETEQRVVGRMLAELMVV